MPQEYNAQLIEQLATNFPRRIEPNYAWGNALGGLLLTPRLRGQWGVSSDENWYLYDHSGQNRTLTPQGVGDVPIPTRRGITPYIVFQKTKSTYYTRADENGLDLSTVMSIWTWVRFRGNANTGQPTAIFGKWTDAGQASYLLFKAANDTLRFYISWNGAAAEYATDGGVNYLEDAWLFLCGIFIANTGTYLIVGNANTGRINLYISTYATRATIFNSNSPLTVAAYSNLYHLDGDMSLFGLGGQDLEVVTAFNMFHQTRPLFMG